MTDLGPRKHRGIMNKATHVDNLYSAYEHWQPPTWAMGFDALFDVWGADGAFTIREANHA